MIKHAKLLKDGYAMKIKDYEDFPYKEIISVFRPDKSRTQLAKEFGIPQSTFNAFIIGNRRSYTNNIIRFLGYFGIEMILLKDNEIYSKDLDVEKLVYDKHRLIRKLGLGKTYFSNGRKAYRIDIYLDILDYLGLELAIIEKGE